MLTRPLRGNAPVSTSPSIREARLRAEFAELYPGIEPGVWFTAATLADHMIARLLRQGNANLALVPRTLNPDHFEFRGGEGPAGDKAVPGRRTQDQSPGREQ
jgi:hypothetical protein